MEEIGIVMAAGMGVRMRPFSEYIAKPLARAKGVPLVETVVTALENRGVREIFVVVGYKKEQFAFLTRKFANLRLVENPCYAMKNNIASVAAVTDLMRETSCFICEADLYVTSPKLLCRPLEKSGFFARFVTGHSDDWLFEIDDMRRILAFHKGGDNKFNLSGISFFTPQDARMVADIIDTAIRDPANNQCFWDEVVCRHATEIDLTIHEVAPNDIIECDTLSDLQTLELQLS